MSMLEKKTLLQINATIITGLLILLTIQATTEGGIPFLLELFSLKNKVSMYNDAMNDTSLDPFLLDAMKKRQAELKIKIMEKEIELENVSVFWLAQLILNPITTFTFSMLFFIVSIILEIDNKMEKASKPGTLVTIVGLSVMLAAIFLMMIMPIS